MITPQELRNCMRQAGFQLPKLAHAEATITLGLTIFRENKARHYYGQRGRIITRPTSAHITRRGRHDITEPANIFMSALCRAWMIGTGKKPTLNNKKNPDSAFFKFAKYIVEKEGIGHSHQRFEGYWSFRKKTWENNRFLDMKWRISGGSFQSV